MQEKNDDAPAPIQPDLKHDNMEYAASTEGDDKLDLDNETIQEIEDEEITAEELQLLEEDDVDNQAEALNSATTDSLADDDNFLGEKGDEDELGDIAEDAAKSNDEEADEEYERG